MNNNSSELPVGEPIAASQTLTAPTRKSLKGRYISLLAVDPERDCADLYACSHGSARHDQIWTYMAYGPFRDQADMQSWLETQAQSDDPLFFAVVDNTTQRAVGIVTFMSIVPAMRRLELGNIWYGLDVQRGKTNTEAVYLMLKETFEELHYRRAEWKCDSLNARSRAAALRLGFQYEGLFRQHLIVKQRNRDTTWFSMMDHEWPAIKANMERWLYGDEEGLSLSALNQSLT